MTTQNHGIGGIFKNLDSAKISTFNKSLVANLSVKVQQGLHLSSKHNISFGHLCFLSGHHEKKCLEIQVRENEVSVRGVTLNFKFNLHVHGGKLPVITFVSCVKKRENTIRGGLYRENEKIYTRYGLISWHQHRYLGMQYALEKDETRSKWVLCMPTSCALQRPSQPKHPCEACSGF